MVAVLDEGHFKAQQGVLAEVHVHRMDLSRSIQQIIQHITAGAGDDHSPTFRVKLEELTVYAWIFPTGVINQAVAVEESKKLFLQFIYHAPPSNPT